MGSCPTRLKSSFTSVRRCGQSGVTLIEIMIVVAISGIMALALASMNADLMRVSRSITKKTEFNSLVAMFQGVFNNSNACVAAFGGEGVFQVNASIDSSTPQLLAFDPNSSGTQALSITAGDSSSMPMMYGRLEVTKFELVNRAAMGTIDQHILDLQLLANRKLEGEDSAIGGETMAHLFQLVVWLDADNKITQCSGIYDDFWIKSDTPANSASTMVDRAGVGTKDPETRLDIVGTVQADIYWYRSDKRLKTNFRPIPNALDRTLALEGVMFDWKEKTNPERKDNQLGLLAQDVEKIFPELVTTHQTTGKKAVDYGKLVVPLIEAIKEQQALIEEQKREIEAIKKSLQ